MKKRPILLRSIYGLKEQRTRTMIGLIGTHPGAGVTHTGLLLSSFLGNVLGRKTAFLEMNTHHDFAKIQLAYCGKGEVVDSMFKMRRVTCYRQVSQLALTDILNEDYEYIIFDFGWELGKNRNDFLRCDTKLVVSSLIDWKRDDLFRFLLTYQELKGCDSWIYLFVFGQKRDLLDLKRSVKLKARLIGYEPIPYLLSKETMGLFHSII